jgi:hypothetical protein
MRQIRVKAGSVTSVRGNAFPESRRSGLEIREYGRRDHPQKLAVTSPTNGCRSLGIVRSRTQPTEFSFESLRFFTSIADSTWKWATRIVKEITGVHVIRQCQAVKCDHSSCGTRNQQ